MILYNINNNNFLIILINYLWLNNFLFNKKFIYLKLILIFLIIN